MVAILTGESAGRLLGLSEAPVLEAPPVDRWVIEVVTVSGRAAAVEFRFRLDFVEVWSREHLCAAIDRDLLRAWLSEQPRKPLALDEVALSMDRMVDHQGRVAISLPDVRAWTLSPVDLVNLRDRV